MEHTATINMYEDIVVPESALLHREEGNRYGSVPGLEEEELADPVELERQVMYELFGPVMALPQEHHGRWRPEIDESGGLDFGAFGTVDFRRLMPEFDRARYKAEKLRQELKHVIIMLSIVKERLPGRSKYLVLKNLRMGFLSMEDILDRDMASIARWYLRARGLRQQITELEEYRRSRREKRLNALACES